MMPRMTKEIDRFTDEVYKILGASAGQPTIVYR
jgi:hypothetical protein